MAKTPDMPRQSLEKPQRSLEKRIAITLLAVFMLAGILIVIISQLLLKRYYQSVMLTDEQTSLNNMASRIEQRLDQGKGIISRQAALLHDGQRLLPDQMLQERLDAALTGGYFADLVLLNPQGVAVSDTPVIPGRKGYDYNERAFLQQFFAEPEIMISPPLLGKNTRLPSLFFIAPVFGSQQQLLGVLTGRYPLESEPYLQQVRREFLPKGGELYVVDNSSGRLVSSRDSAHIFSPVAQHPKFSLLTKVREASAQVGKTDTWYYSKVHYEPMQWDLIKLIPAAQFEQPINDIVRSYTLFLLLLLGVVTALVLLAIRHHMAPVTSIIRQLRERLEKGGTEDIKPPRESDFIPLVKAFNELLQQRRQQEQLKDDFLAMVSHELRTPLTSIKGALAFLQASGPQQALLLQVARRNTDRAVTMVSDLLDLAAIARGRLAIRPEPFCPQILLEQVVEEMSPIACARGIHINLQLPQQGRGSLSSDHLGADNQGAILVDAARFKQVIANLLSNAIKFSAPNTQVELSMSQFSAGWLRISVLDQGEGVPEAFRSSIFQRFSQANPLSERSSEGSGLGLSISRELVELMGGRIDYHSKPGVGSCFFVEFPWHRRDQEDVNVRED